MAIAPWIIFALFICSGQAVDLHWLSDILLDHLVQYGSIGSKQKLAVPTEAPPFVLAVPAADDYSGIAVTVVVVIGNTLIIKDAFERALLPQPTTKEETFEIVKRVEDLSRPNDEPQYKHTEDVISRALNDLRSTTTESISDGADVQTILWRLERARLVDSEVILLMDGLLGRSVASVDLMKNIKVNLKVMYSQIHRSCFRIPVHL